MALDEEEDEEEEEEELDQHNQPIPTDDLEPRENIF